MMEGFPERKSQFRSLREALEPRRPVLGVTQGGSSKKNSGANVAAVNANLKDYRKRKKPNG